MGLLDMLPKQTTWAGFKQPNPIASWANQNPYALQGIGRTLSAVGSGLTGHASDTAGMFSGVNDALAAQQGPLGMLALQQRQYAQQQKDVQKAQQQQSKTVQLLISKGRQDLADAVQNGLMSGGDAYKMFLEPAKAVDQPAAIQEYQFAVGQGYTGTFADYQKELRRAAATNIDFNANQGVAAGYADRMAAADKVLEDPKLLPAMTDATKPFISNIPVAGNFMVGSEYQVAEQAQRDFLNAILRRESGAVISPSEFDNAKRQYFPQPGDSPEVIAQKAANRKMAIEGVARSAGPNYALPGTSASTGDPELDQLLQQYGN